MIGLLLLTLLGIPAICLAEDMKSPEFYSFTTYLWVMTLAATGGLISYLDKLGRRKITRYKTLRLLQEIVVAMFTGTVVFFICEWANFSQLITAACVAVAGHMGNRGLLFLETIIQRRLKIVVEEHYDGSTTDNQDSR